MTETCLDVVVLPDEEGSPLICTLEMGHHGPHSNGPDRWVSGGGR